MSYKLQYPRILRSLNIQDLYTQLILFELDKYNFGISLPDCISPLPGMIYKTMIIFENKEYYLYKIPKTDSSIIRQINILFDDETWMKECNVILKYELNELARSIQKEDNDFEIIIYEYSPKYLIIVGAPENYTKFPRVLQKYQDYKYSINNQLIHVHGIAKSNTFVIKELEKIFGQFQNLYAYTQIKSNLPTTEKMLYIYVLQLEKNKYYIGKTTNPKFRIFDHFNSEGSAWTKKYEPISILEIISTNDHFDEDKITLKYMSYKGIDNVRGGSFSQVNLSEESINTIKHMIKGSTDQCFICGSNQHFANECNVNEDINLKIKFIDEPCKCITSFFSSHRKSKCLLNNILK